MILQIMRNLRSSGMVLGSRHRWRQRGTLFSRRKRSEDLGHKQTRVCERDLTHLVYTPLPFGAKERSFETGNPVTLSLTLPFLSTIFISLLFAVFLPRSTFVPRPQQRSESRKLRQSAQARNNAPISRSKHTPKLRNIPAK